MSTFCGGTGTVPAFTVDELRDTFKSGVLPPSMPPMENGLAEAKWVEEYVKQLDARGTLPKPPLLDRTVSNMFGAPEEKDPLALYSQKEKSLQDSIKEEYCFYERRYFSALDGFLSSVSNASLKGDSAPVDAKLQLCRLLNQKVTLLTQIVNGIAKYRFAKNIEFQGEINSINETLKKRQQKLIEQAEILNRESAAADLNKQMVTYTTEKNKANQNLLTIFGVLNVVALAMVFYVAKN